MSHTFSLKPCDWTLFMLNPCKDAKQAWNHKWLDSLHWHIDWLLFLILWKCNKISSGYDQNTFSINVYNVYIEGSTCRITCTTRDYTHVILALGWYDWHPLMPKSSIMLFCQHYPIPATECASLVPGWTSTCEVKTEDPAKQPFTYFISSNSI